ncbi:copper homeostasis protein CutC [Staphylococcus massiliensis]|uniref:copper homeostasis protein CutC n=1 Tax=Staphylococcus massiliensis TaxID=555791 RepID=UPI001EDF148D|nr:copper homeostasis protein CutC [Staphylococcus massiliensis]MCG3399139.1 copper homeostasis protein CutC [Staphylococcus massiliensis]
MIKEAVVTSIESVKYAIEHGADRIELCDNLDVGGTTPSYGMVQTCISLCHMEGVEVAVMIRPRGGNFVYDLYDFEVMQQDIKALRQLDVDYFVFGCLTRDHTIDRWQMETLKDLCVDIPAVCHMAFDEVHVHQQQKALQTLIELGFRRVLMHGGPASSSVFDNLNHIAKLVMFAKGAIEIMPGGDITKDNLDALLDAFPFQEVHGSKIV